MIRTPREFGIPEGYLVQIDLEGESEPHIYPQEFLVIEPQAVVVGDDLGIRVASYPYQRFSQQEDGSWKFYGPVGNYTMRPGPREDEF